MSQDAQRENSKRRKLTDSQSLGRKLTDSLGRNPKMPCLPTPVPNLSPKPNSEDTTDLILTVAGPKGSTSVVCKPVTNGILQAVSGDGSTSYFSYGTGSAEGDHAHVLVHWATHTNFDGLQQPLPPPGSREEQEALREMVAQARSQHSKRIERQEEDVKKVRAILEEATDNPLTEPDKLQKIVDDLHQETVRRNGMTSPDAQVAFDIEGELTSIHLYLGQSVQVGPFVVSYTSFHQAPQVIKTPLPTAHNFVPYKNPALPELQDANFQHGASGGFCITAMGTDGRYIYVLCSLMNGSEKIVKYSLSYKCIGPLEDHNNTLEEGCAMTVGALFVFVSDSEEGLSVYNKDTGFVRRLEVEEPEMLLSFGGGRLVILNHSGFNVLDEESLTCLFGVTDNIHGIPSGIMTSFSPEAVAFFQDEIYILEKKRVLVFSASKPALLRQVKLHGDMPQRMSEKPYMAVDSNNIYVGLGRNVYVFDRRIEQGSPICVLSADAFKPGDNDPNFSHVDALCIQGDRLLVASGQTVGVV